MSQEALRDVLEAIADGREVDSAQVHRLREHDAATADLIEQVTDRMTRLRRRDNEFAAVIAMTHDLVAQRSGSLLQSIVDRAHELLGSDMTYVSAFDRAERSFVVRAVKGAVSPDFLGMVVPPGVGIATRVVDTMAPIWVDNYFEAEGFPHDARIDDILVDEQVYSILGVPLIANQRILGVLFVADRRMRRYSPEDISLARSFADHAAVVIEQRKLVGDLHSATRKAQAVADDVRRASALHEDLTRLVAGGSDPETVAQALAQALGRRIAVVDADAELLAGESTLLDGGAELQRALSKATRDAESVSLADGRVDYVAAIVVQQSAVGALLVERNERALTKWDQRSIERSGIAFALLRMQQRAEDLAEERIRGELAHELIDAHGNRAYAIERVRTRGMSTAKPWSLAHFTTNADDAERVLRALRKSPELLVTQTNGVFWALAAQCAAPQRIAQAFQTLGARQPLTVTADGSSLVTLLDEVDAVRGARAFLSSMGESHGVFSADAFAPYTVMFSGDGARAGAFISASIQPILDWDAKRSTELFETLLASLDEQGSVTGIGRRLGVHANTVRQRLDRISQLLSSGWQLPDARFRLETAVRLEAARRSMRTHSSL
ncbi:helix-turn-helix domain-containing protein [Agrococcus casei]|uniref:helix-turn-helix domain-containing protein n=1 Tax=Agrococcus casei TaxID=343512 RepID=UPI003F937C6C